MVAGITHAWGLISSEAGGRYPEPQRPQAAK